MDVVSIGLQDTGLKPHEAVICDRSWVSEEVFGLRLRSLGNSAAKLEERTRREGINQIPFWGEVSVWFLKNYYLLSNDYFISSASYPIPHCFGLHLTHTYVITRFGILCTSRVFVSRPGQLVFSSLSSFALTTFEPPPLLKAVRLQTKTSILREFLIWTYVYRAPDSSCVRMMPALPYMRCSIF